MLAFLFKAATRLRPFRKAFIALVVLSALLAVYGLTRSGILPSLWLQLGLSSTLFWALLLAATDIFHKVPAPATPAMPWWRRTKRRAVRFFYALLAVLVMFTALVLVNTSFKLFSV